MSRLIAIALVAACGGSDSNPPGSAGSVTGTIDDGTGPVTFDDDCDFFASEDLLHVTSTDAQTGVEVSWDPAIVDQPGSYTTSGIVPDITLAALVAGTIRAAEGTVTFTILDDTHAAGSLELTAGRITGTAQFDCTR